MNKNRKQLRQIVLFISLLILLLVGYLTYSYISNRAPEVEIQIALKRLSVAKNEQADQYANEKYSEAEQLFKQTMSEWKVQNEKWFVLRDYSQVRIWALQSDSICSMAIDDAQVEKAAVDGNLSTLLLIIKDQLDTFEIIFWKLPLDKSTFKTFSEGRLKYNEALEAQNQGSIYIATQLAHASAKLVSKASDDAEQFLRLYFKDYGIWQKNTQLALELSKKGKTVVYINKLASTCFIYRSGKILASFKAEFGKNWIGDKVKMGDKATPEGVYQITRKKSRNETKFYKSLLINFPNKDDLARFENLKSNGSIPPNTKIGNLIEIHGHGGKGVHWTDGCIAVSNEDMDIIYDYCKVSTPVIIVGSDKPLEAYFKKVQR